MRVIVVSSDPDELPDADARLDAEIRVGGDAGASEVIMLRACGDAGARPGEPRHGPAAARCAGRRLVARHAPAVPVEAAARPHRPAPHHGCRDAARPAGVRSHALGENYAPGDTDFAWTRLTLWREQLAAVLDQPPYEPVTGVRGHAARSTRRRPRSSRRGCGCSSMCRSTVRTSRPWTQGRTASTACASSATSGADRARARRRPASPRLRQPGQPDARRRAPPPQPPRLPRRRAPPPRPR